MENSYFLALFFFLVAIFYSSVGFGGGSSYLAILVIAGVDIYLLRSTALMCNIIVVSGGTYIFYREGYLNLRKAVPLVMASVPMAFLGGYLPLRAAAILILLGFSLLLASILLWFKDARTAQEGKSTDNSTKTAGLIGGGIGLLSGMVGIGGGIFLSPILNLINWSKAKNIAAIASFFILVNSIAGLAGQWMQHSPNVDLNWAWPLLLAVFLGGQIGSRLAVKKFDSAIIRRTTAVLILIASMKILNDHLFHFEEWLSGL
ncbi:sulfite exporter TauE/SafE family protein [Fulvivirga kasyanovii]|uniref:Probable membrane transporter protein n=1 Tax=Fulvivirga kasyanovii TaxID=396812 RepID=A0ABW9RRV8_9BACT|nr:sulfite exporter TauE/SafE family protein [Fulvivirga kasyanovii]MTI26441.1 sulfite exporter TauE/SafE family protein [Fulvivirga kasyanovii]